MLFVIKVKQLFLTLIKGTTMEKYMFIFKGGQSGTANLSPEEMQQQMQKWMAWIQSLTEKEIYVGGEPLENGGKIVTKSGNKIVVTDGPFPETKELVGGYFIVNANDIAHAAEIAKDCPGFEYGGTVEVRPVMKIDI
jgi:hypothetical protein